jgi:hypothetical protein
MSEFQIAERQRAFARAMEHLRAALGHVRAAQSENVSFSLNLGELAHIDRTLMHEIYCCERVYKQPPETPA